MGWLIAILLVIAAFAVPRFGKALLVVIGLGAAGLFVLYENGQREEAAAKSLVKPQELEFTDLRLGSQSGSYRLSGRLRNTSQKFSVESLQLKITLLDCVTAGDCATVGDSTEYIFISVPPGQTRGIDESVYFSDVPPFRGSFSWRYSVAEVRAK